MEQYLGEEIDHTTKSQAIPLHNVQEALDYMRYASVERVMFRMLYLTGCRISELDNMETTFLFGDVLYWPLGKNQKTWRSEQLPIDYIKELSTYRKKNRTTDTQLFGISHTSFRRYFNRDIRPFLPKRWTTKRLVPKAGKLTTQYVLQIKGLRKDFQTLDFAQKLKEWGDASIALEFTSKRMKHSSKHLTAHHYIENFDTLGIKRIVILDPHKVLEQRQQMRIQDYRTPL